MSGLVILIAILLFCPMQAIKLFGVALVAALCPVILVVIIVGCIIKEIMRLCR